MVDRVGVRARGWLVLGVVVACVLAGCTTSKPERDDVSTSASATTTASPSTASTIDDAADLRRVLHTGFDGLDSATVEVTGGGGPGDFRVDAEMTLSAGGVTALRLTGQLPGRTGLDEVVVVGGVAYLRASDPPDSSATPWHRVAATGGDPLTAGLAGVVDTVVATAAVGRLADVFAAAGSFTLTGVVNGGERYTTAGFEPAAATLASALGADVTLLRAFIDVAGNGQPVRLTSQLTVDGAQVSVSETWTSFDTDVVVDLPTAGQIATG